MKLSIQIVNFNSRTFLERCIDSIRKHKPSGWDIEVVVINNDREPVEEFLREIPTDFEIKTLEINQNVGFGRAHNLGFKKTSFENILFLNPDTELLPGTLSALAESFSQDDKIGIVGPLLVNTDGQIQPGYCGERKTPLSIIRAKIQKGKTEQKALKPGKNVNEVDWVAGTAMLVKRRVFERIGGFDENYFMYFEDVDLCLQAEKIGYRTAVNPQAKIFHSGGKSFSSQKDKKKYYYASQDYYMRKNFGLTGAFLIKIFRLPHYFKNVYFGNDH